MSYYQGQQSGQYPADEYSTPSTPREPAYPQWEQPQQESQHSQDPLQQALEQQSQQGLEQSQQHHQPLSLPPPPQPSMYLENPQHLVPSQIPQRGTHDLTPIRLLPVVGQPPTRSPPVEIKPVMLHVDTAVRSTAHAGPSTRPASRARPHQFHPYPRPSSAAGASRRDYEAHHHVRFASQTNTPQAHPGSARHSPATTTRQTFTSPPMSEYGQPQGSSPSFASTSPGATFAPFTPVPPAPRHTTPAADTHRYIIRADTHYDPGTRVLTALLELPGVKRADLSITLTTTLFNRVRHVSVTGTSRSPFAPALTAVRERKYGRFTRSFPVPPDTKPEDIDAAMEDGVLVLKISCGLPAASTDEHEIPIR